MSKEALASPKDEALKLALEALESINEMVDYEGNGFRLEVEIAAIKAALAQPTSGDYALGYVEGFNDACKPKHEWVCGECVKCGQSIERQEPVAYFNPQVKGGFYWARPTKITAPVTVNVEPIPLYTTPPQRKPLTRGQIREIEVDVSLNPSFDYITPAEQLCRAIEQAHGIKE